MKKYSKIGYAVVLISAFALAGCGQKNAQNSNAPGQTSSADSSGQSVAEKVKQSLYDLVTTGAGVKCTIDDPKMGQLTMYAKGDKAKVEGFQFTSMSDALSNASQNTPPKEEKGTMINDGTWAYMWSGAEGMKFNINDMKNLAPKDQNQAQNQDNSQSSATDWKDWIKQMDNEGTKYDCSPAVLSDADFTPPSNVKFQDWGELLKGFVKMGGAKYNPPNWIGPPQHQP